MKKLKRWLVPLSLSVIVVPLSLFLLSIGCGGEDTPVSSSTSKVTTGRPNIVFILTDDLNDEVFNKDTGLQTLLTANGTKFHNNFVNVALCCPSRVATLRGQCAHNSGIFTNTSPDGGFAKVYADGLEKSTIATWLHAPGTGPRSSAST